MSLTTALSIAQTALFNTSRQTSVVSNNIANASNEDYGRRSAVTSTAGNGAQIVTIQRAANDALFRQNIEALSSYQGQSALLDGLNQLDLSINGSDDSTSPATLLGQLQQAINLYSATPSNASLASSAIDSATQMAQSLNNGTEAIQDFRAQMDSQISSAVSKLNNLLQNFDQANKAVISGTRSGSDVSDALDQRDSILKQIAQYIPVSTMTRGDNDMVLTTADGTTLYETVPRTIAFDPKAVYTPSTTGNSITIDGVPLQPGSGGNTTASGSIAAMLQLRDDVAPTMQSQLDEIARGLISSFAETDQSGTGQPDAPGLFTWSGAPSMPAAGTVTTGLAGSIRVNPLMDPSQGGDATLLRDGGANGADYKANSSGGASYSDLLIKYTQNLEQPMNFDPSAGAGDKASVLDYSTNTISWLENMRQAASTAADNKNALATKTQTALSNATGVNMDEEMSQLLDLEHAYQASAQLMKTVNDMLNSLMEAVN
ncbi:MAG TPA: flagellar hook-associated protein FlgK [Rhizobiaceae bacterium]|nr:flagellar hook-associated protein FlgK [Rhizobiaceae bacterium]